MRFLADGPTIPDELLVARDEGRVIFFCGAGVSRARAGLLDFFGLAKRVTDSLGVTADDPVRKLIDEAAELDLRIGISGLISADRVFGLLERDFLVREIEVAVANALKPRVDIDLSAHQIMLDLARFPDGKTRLVTTNFDLLFESCNNSLPYHRPPRLPDPLRQDEFEGIIHLHGHVDKDYHSAYGDGFVLSSSAFGHAYLADGWATRFIQAILEKFIIVFVGYAADDPPVLYLLEALNRHQKHSSGMYAFQAGSQSDAEAKWRHKGVLPIAYDDAEDHKSLWDTLSAWACRAQDPDAWYGKVIDMACKGPRDLSSHERGQVAHIVSTLEGAKKFAGSENPLPAEWLCVFDPAIRYLKPGTTGSYLEREPFFDPFDAYGLDSDPKPKTIDPDDYWAKREVPEGVWNCFAATRVDRQSLFDTNLASIKGASSINVPKLLNRFRQLGYWISKICSEPTAIWWASHQTGIHPDIQSSILFELERKKQNATPDVRLAWRYVFEAWRAPKKNFHDWYQLKAAIDIDGWNDAAVREIAALWRPYLKIGWPYTGGPKPPENSEEVSIRKMINPDVEYQEFHEKVEIPDECLVTALREFRKNLENAASLEKELGTYTYLTLCPIEPDPDLGGEPSERYYGISNLFLFYVGLFRRLTALSPKTAKQEYLAWWHDDDNIFARLRLWSAGRKELFSGSEAGHLFCSLDDNVFWDGHHQRDLMLALNGRWSDLPTSLRMRLERRLLQGRSRWHGEEKTEYDVRRAFYSLNRIHWLADMGCSFSFDLQAESKILQQLAPEWQREYSAKAAASMEGRGGLVGTDTEHSELLTVPLDNLLDKAKELSGREYETMINKDPFAGLAAERPVRAFSALKRAAKRDEWPEWAWRTFLYSPARANDKPRFSAVVVETLANSSTESVARFIHPASEWLLKSSNTLLRSYPNQFERVWSKILEALRSTSDRPTSLAVQGDKERAWVTEALNSPVGKLSQVLMNDPQKENSSRGKGFPIQWTSHVEELLALSGDHRRYALVIFMFNINWFFFIAPDWTEINLISALSKEEDDQQAFWDGFFWGARVPDGKLYLRLKACLLKLPLSRNLIGRREGNNLAGILLAGWGSTYKKTGERYITTEEMRTVLLHADDNFRGQVIWQVERFCFDDKNQRWRLLLPLFLKEVWPRQKLAKSPAITAKLCNLAFSNEAMFPVVAEAILPLVTKIEDEGFTFPHIRASHEKIIQKHPEKTLALLWNVLPESAERWPYGIGEAFSKIEEAKPSLKNDRRLVELKRRWNAR